MEVLPVAEDRQTTLHHSGCDVLEEMKSGVTASGLGPVETSHWHGLKLFEAFDLYPENRGKGEKLWL
jgi:hypothetical protein